MMGLGFMNMTVYDYHNEHKGETMQAGMDQPNKRGYSEFSLMLSLSS